MMFEKLVKWWLTVILLLIPFQGLIAKGGVLERNELTAFFNYIDEITIVILLPFAIRAFYKNREIPYRLYFILLLPILFFSLSGFISGMVNKNSLFITMLGIFDYIKNFLVIFIYAAFIRTYRNLKRIFNLLLILAVFFGVIAFIQEFYALVSRYIFEKDINDSGIYILRNVSSDNNIDLWRFGIYRTPSLLYQPNMQGLYSLLILTIYLSMVKKVNFVIFNFLFAGVFTSVSRMVYVGFIFIAGLQVFKGRRWLIALICPIAILLFFMFVKPEFLTSQLLNKPGNKAESIHKERVGKRFANYREYARYKALTVWKDHPFWGVGPGMYGGVISIIYNSPVYERYPFSPKSDLPILKSFRSLDQFWPQVLAEMGVIGTVVFAGLLISLFIIIFILRQRTNSIELKGLLTGLATSIIIIIIYLLGSGLNIAPVLFTYCALVGIGLGCGTKN